MKLFIVCLLATWTVATKIVRHEKRGVLIEDAPLGLSPYSNGFYGHRSFGHQNFGLNLKSNSLVSGFGSRYANSYDYSPWSLKSRTSFGPERITVHKEVQVPILVPHPVPIEVTRYVAVPRPVPVKVNKPYPVLVPHPVPVEIVRHVPIKVDRPYPVTIPVEVKVPHPVPVPVSYDLGYTSSELALASYTRFRSGLESTLPYNSGYSYSSPAKKW